MAKRGENKIIEGEIIEIMPNTMFKILLDTPDDKENWEVIGVPSGKMRRGFMRLMPGQRVKVEMTPYDENRGRIVATAEKRYRRVSEQS